jgi:ureidoacrylate peracid hydrolase
MAYYKPDKQSREVPLNNNSETALLFIDTQVYNCCKRTGAIYQSLTDVEKENEEIRYYFQGVDTAIHNWKALQKTARQANVEVLYTVIQSLTKDGRDRGLDYKISGFHVPWGSVDAQVLPQIAPLEDEIVLPKTSSSVFNSTNIHYILGNLGPIKQLIIAGCVTDQCVEHAVRDACDLNYLVTLVTGTKRLLSLLFFFPANFICPKSLIQTADACVTYSEERHQASLKAIAGYCRQRTTEEVTEELQQLQRR